MVPTIRHQRRVKGGRVPRGTALLRALDREVERQARLFGVSKSFVIATALGTMLGIDAQEDYRRIDRPRRFKKAA